MADERPTGDPGSEGAGDAADAAAEHAEGADGGDGALNQPTTEELLRQLAALKAQNELYERVLGPGPDDAGGDRPPTQDPRAVRAEQDETEQLEHEVKALALKKDPLSRALLAEKSARLHDRQQFGQALAALNEKVDMLALPETERGEFGGWLRQNRHRFADMEAARMAFKGSRAASAPTPPAGGGPRPTAAGRTVLRKDVDASPRPLPKQEHEARVMTNAQFKEEQERLRDAGDYEAARALGRAEREGSIIVND